MVKVWLALAIVKTLMGYYQMPMVLRIMAKHSKRNIETSELIQLIILSPIVNFFVTPYYLLKEKMHFFEPYDEAYIESKFKDVF